MSVSWWKLEFKDVYLVAMFVMDFSIARDLKMNRQRGVRYVKDLDYCAVNLGKVIFVAVLMMDG